MYNFKIPKKYIFIAIGTAIGILSILFISNLVSENILPKKLKIAAGKKDGESYIISEAIAKVVADKTGNIQIDVCETDGTDDNLRAIEGKELEGKRKECEPGQVDLATAQADRLSSSMPVRSIAILYEDNLQLLVKPEKLGFDSENLEQKFHLSDLNGKIIVTPKGSGQRQSLTTISKYLDFSPKHSDSSTTDEGDALFYIRSLGNQKISQLIQKGWRLVSIENASALQSKGYYYYRKSKIPKNNYKIDPQEEIQTIAIDRLLLAHKDVPDWAIKRIAEVLDKHNKEIENEIVRKNKKAVASLVRNIKKPDNNLDVNIHPGVDAYYESKEDSVIAEKADFIAVILTIIGLMYSGYLNLKDLQANETIKQVIDLIQQSLDEVNQVDEDLNLQLKKLFQRYKEVNLIFEKASVSLDSQGFYAFSEVYKSAREIIEKEIEEKQRRISSGYVQELVDFLKTQKNPEQMSKELEKMFIERASSLLKDEIFSRESFQTFTEAYDIARYTLEGRKQNDSNDKVILNGSNSLNGYKVVFHKT